MAEAFDIKKFFDFSPTALGKALSIGLKIAVMLGLVFLTVKPHFFPNPSTKQEAEEIINNTYAPKSTFGCSSIRVREYNDAKNPVNAVVK